MLPKISNPPAGVLFINSPEPDGIQDLTYSGLAKLLGPERVIDFPWNRYYHLDIRKYPANHGYTPGSLWKSIRAQLNRKQFDYVIVGSAKPRCFAAYLSIFPEIPSSVPVAFVDGGDFRMIGGDLTRLEHAQMFKDAISRRPFDLVFKREYLVGSDLGQNVFPFPFSFNFDQVPRGLPSIKRYDVSFWAVESHPLRTKALDLLADKFDCFANGTARGQVAKRYKRKGMDYLRELAACKIVLNIPGVGWDTQRYWEVLAVGGFLISVKPQIVIPSNFEDGKHLVFCKDDLSDLIGLCEYYLREQTQREGMARAASAHCRQYHSDLARAEFMMQRLSEL